MAGMVNPGAGVPAGSFFPIRDMEFENLEPEFPFVDLIEAETEIALDEANLHYYLEDEEE